METKIPDAEIEQFNLGMKYKLFTTFPESY